MYFEDLADKFEHEHRPPSRPWRIVRVVGPLVLILAWIVLLQTQLGGNPPTIVYLLLFVVSFVALVGVPFWTWQRERRIGPAHCPHCQQLLGAFHREQIFKTRACPLCGWVFRSRLPPEARKITFDPATLPRVWLQGELETAKVVDEPAPLDANVAEDMAEPNPYRASAVVTPPSVGMGAATQGCLTAWWHSLIGPPLMVFSNRERILRDPNLAVLADGDPTRQRERDDAFVRSQRRMAWLLLLCCHAPPLAFVVLYWQQSAQEELTTRLLLAVGGGLLVSLLGLFFAAMLLSLSPRPLKRFWMGSRGPVRASLDTATGYFGIRIRILHQAQQDQLPRVRFRYRRSPSGSVQLRVVNFPQATALELDLAPTEAGQWLEAECDLLLMVRQSDPDFVGDELHLVADPAAKLECSDFDALPRF